MPLGGMRRGRSPPRVATPDRPDGKTPARPGSSGSLPGRHAGFPLGTPFHKERITLKDLPPLDIPDLLHTLLELNHGEPPVQQPLLSTFCMDVSQAVWAEWLQDVPGCPCTRCLAAVAVTWPHGAV